MTLRSLSERGLFPGLFLLSAGLNVLLGVHGWAAVLGGSLTDPDSYMRLVRLEQGIRAGHLVTVVARDDSGAGVMVEWSRLLDMLLWLMAAPMALVIGWHKALFIAGVVLGPLGVGVLGLSLAWAVEPFAARRFLWSAAVAAAILPALLTFALPGVVHYHILLLALIAATAGFVVRAWGGDTWNGFLAGLSGGFAIWLTPETMPFVLMCFGALLFRWLQTRIGAALLACAAGFFDVLGFGLAIDPPHGGYGVAEIDRLSLVYVVLAILLLGGAAALLRMDTRPGRLRRAAGLALMAVLIIAWVAMFPNVAMGPYGIMSPEDMRKFFGVMLELQTVRGAALMVFLAPGALAVAYALWRAWGQRGRWVWLYVAVCTLVALALGAKFILFIGFSACMAAALLPVALSEASLSGVPALARVAVLIAVLGVPVGAEFAHASSPKAAPQKFPSCSLRHVAPLLAVAGSKIVLAEAQDTPEILYRSQAETVGSLYQHGVPGFLRSREAWRAMPGAAEPGAVKATGAAFVLFCPKPGRYLPVSDIPPDTLWDALEADKPPQWLQPAGNDASGWRLYRIAE